MIALAIALLILAVAAGAVTFTFRRRIAELEAVDRAARADQSAERARLERLCDDVSARLTAVEEREDECAKLTQQTATQRETSTRW